MLGHLIRSISLSILIHSFALFHRCWMVSRVSFSLQLFQVLPPISHYQFSFSLLTCFSLHLSVFPLSLSDRSFHLSIRSFSFIPALPAMIKSIQIDGEMKQKIDKWKTSSESSRTIRSKLLETDHEKGDESQELDSQYRSHSSSGLSEMLIGNSSEFESNDEEKEQESGDNHINLIHDDNPISDRLR